MLTTTPAPVMLIFRHFNTYEHTSFSLPLIFKFCVSSWLTTLQPEMCLKQATLFLPLLCILFQLIPYSTVSASIQFFSSACKLLADSLYIKIPLPQSQSVVFFSKDFVDNRLLRIPDPAMEIFSDLFPF